MTGPGLFDRAQQARNRHRAAAAGAPHFLICRVASDLAERIGVVTRNFDLMLDLSARPGRVAAATPAGRVGRSVVARLAGNGRNGSQPAVVLESEALPFGPGAFDLVASALVLHGVGDLPGMLVQINRILKPDGLFLAAFFGGATLSELREAFALAEVETSGGASPRVMPFTDVRAAGHLLQRAGFALPVADTERLTVRYRDPLALMADLRAMGEANALAERARKPLGRRLLGRAIEAYRDLHSDPDGRVRATFEIVTITGWRPAPGQPKALAPGSARRRLADALGTRENSAGERAPGQRKR